MHGGMTRSKSSAMAKIAVSVPRSSLERVRRAVRSGRAASVSAYVSAAIAERAKLDDLEDLLAEMLAETGGPLTRAERRAADRALGVARPRKGRAA
jgi:Arc/MetJ-type ribon-helix-helix transcriptional regulator